jgi:hypothetical protein
VRILTVRQPYAWAIIHGGKDVENRSRNIAGDYRGPVAIHAALQDSEDGWDALIDMGGGAYARAAEGAPGAPEGGAGRGVIIGVVDLVDVHSHFTCTPTSSLQVRFDGKPCSPWALDDHHHLVLENPRPLTSPVLYTGAFGLRELPTIVELGIRDRLPK